MELVCCLAMKDPQVYHHLLPLARHPLVSRLWIVRSHQSAYGTIPKAEYVLTPMPKPWRWLQMLRRCRALAARPNVTAFLSFNPFPYGLISLFAARRFNLPMHFGFVGVDWNRHMHGPLRGFLMPALRQAAFVTAAGAGMRQDMIHRGLDPQQVAVLPHSIDLNRFPVTDPAQAEYAAIFAGQLMALKGVDVILRAFAEVLGQCPGQRLCIVGDGDEGTRLRQMAVDLGIAAFVDFVGKQADVQPFIARARIAVMASHQEGFPFFLVEAISSGLVPVCTPVGAISELIQDGENGFLFPIGDAPGLARRIGMILKDPGLYARLRGKVLRLRKQFSYECATKVWDPWLRRLVTTSDERCGDKS